MAKVIPIRTYRDLAIADATAPQRSVETRNKVSAVLRRLLSGQGLCKVMLAEKIGWSRLTEIVVEFLDRPRIEAYVARNRRAA